MAVARLLRKTNITPEKGSALRTSRHTRANPSIPRRKSTASSITQIRTWGVIWIIGLGSRRLDSAPTDLNLSGLPLKKGSFSRRWGLPYPLSILKQGPSAPQDRASQTQDPDPI